MNSNSRELKHAGKIHSKWSSKGVIKLRHTMNERAISTETKLNYQIFILILPFKKEQKQAGK